MPKSKLSTVFASAIASAFAIECLALHNIDQIIVSERVQCAHINIYINSCL